MKDLAKIRRLVGTITAEQLIYVDYAVTDTVGIFMPVAGQCRYAVTPEHVHPAWSFIVSFDSRCRTLIGGKIHDSIPSTVSFFYRCFTRAFAVSPSDYRKSISIAE